MSLSLEPIREAGTIATPDVIRFDELAGPSQSSDTRQAIGVVLGVSIGMVRFIIGAAS
ncbi:hypothetical protein GCM10027267_11250 [Paramicrobacterium agarici]